MLPVAAREARRAARSWRNYAWRAAIAAIGIALIPSVIVTSKNPAFLGRQLTHALTLMAYLYVIIAGVLRTADSIAEEKRENTLGLLFLTDLKSYDVLAGKLLTSVATIFFGLLAILPVLTIPLLMGGVTPEQLILISINLINTLFLSISIGFLMSTLLRESWGAICLGLVAMFFLVLALPRLITVFVMTGSPLGESIGRILLLFSPTTPFESLFEGALRARSLVESYWSPLAATHLFAWLNIFLTLHFLPIVWRDKPRSVRGQRWWTRMQALRFGGTRTRTRFRKRLLKSNPLFWLAGREQVSSSGLMIVLVAVVSISLTGMLGGIVFGLISLHLILLARMASAASHSLAEDRKSGALELLLATSLSVGDVLRGRWMALGRQFFGPMLIVCFWNLFALIWTSILEPYDGITFLIFCAFPVGILSWVATGWTGMWFGLRARTPTAAMWLTFSVVIVIPLFALLGLLAITGQFQSGLTARDNESAITVALLLWSFHLIFLSSWSASRLRTSFRQSAADRFQEHLPVDWRPVYRFARGFAVSIAVLVTIVFLWRWSSSALGERAFQRALAAHPEFSLKPSDPPFIPADKNLARWDAFNALENGSTRLAPYYQGRGPTSLRDLITLFVPVPERAEWTQGRKFNAAIDSAFISQMGRFTGTFALLQAAAADRPFLQFVQQQNVSPSAMDNLRMLQFHLCARACARLKKGERPLDDSLLALRFAGATTNHLNDFHLLEPMITQAIQPIYDGILSNAWSDDDLAAFQRVYEQMDLFPVFDKWRCDITRLLVHFLEDENISMLAMNAFTFMKKNPAENSGAHVRSEQAAVMKFGLDDLPTVADHKMRTLHPNNYNSADPTVRGFQIVAGATIRQIAHAQTSIDQVVIACAIERFRHENARLPKNLAELSPRYIQKIPYDVVYGEELKYRPQADGKSYLLYSIGFDFIDNGGALENYGFNGDWAWICNR